MDAKDFIKSQLEDLIQKVKGVSVKYAYEECTNFHIIEISPETIRRGSDEFIDWEYSLNNKFSELYPEEDLLISEPSFFNDMRNVIYIHNIHIQGFRNKEFLEPSFSPLIKGFDNCSDNDYSYLAS